jgi:nitroreductase
MRPLFKIAAVVLAVSFLASPAFAEAAKTIQLPAPQTTGGMPLMDALMARHSSREYAPDPLPAQELSNLLWAAFGINRPEKGLRTAPSARNWQEISVYAATADGLYLYDAKANALVLVLPKDIREATGGQPFVKDAPVNLVYVADYAKMGDIPMEAKSSYSAADAAFVSENVYLYCASAGLATVVRGAVNKEALGKAMELGPDRKVVFAQTVGYPKK